jgi:hypothetical protein
LLTRNSQKQDENKAPLAAASVPARRHLKNKSGTSPDLEGCYKDRIRVMIANHFDVDSRGIGFSSFFLPPAKLGAGSFYLAANFDTSGQPLRGEDDYGLHVPGERSREAVLGPNRPQQRNVGPFLNLTRPTLDSLDKGMRKNIGRDQWQNGIATPKRGCRGGLCRRYEVAGRRGANRSKRPRCLFRCPGPIRSHCNYSGAEG